MKIGKFSVFKSHLSVSMGTCDGDNRRIIIYQYLLYFHSSYYFPSRYLKGFLTMSIFIILIITPTSTGMVGDDRDGGGVRHEVEE